MDDRTSHRRRPLRRFMLLMLLVVIAVVSWGIWLWSSKPAYWKEYRVDDPQFTMQGQSLENRLPSELSKVRPLGEPWTITVAQDEINSWIATRLPNWLANRRDRLRTHRLPSRIPEEIKQIMVAIEPRFLALAADIEAEDVNQVMSIEFKPFAGSNGLSRLEMTAMRGGRLWMPEGVIERVIQKYGSAEHAEKQFLEKFRNILLETDLVYPVDSNRVVEVMNLSLRQGELVATCRTVLKKDTVAQAPWIKDKSQD